MKLNEKCVKWKDKLGSLISRYRKNDSSSSDSEFELSSDDGLSVGNGVDEKNAILCYAIMGVTGLICALGTYWSCGISYVDGVAASWLGAVASSLTSVIVGAVVFGFVILLENALLKRIYDRCSNGESVKQTGLAIGCLIFTGGLMLSFFFHVPIPFFLI